MFKAVDLVVGDTRQLSTVAAEGPCVVKVVGPSAEAPDGAVAVGDGLVVGTACELNQT